MKTRINNLRLLNLKTTKSKADKDYTTAEFGDEKDFTKISVFVPEKFIQDDLLEVGVYYDVILNLQYENFRNNIVLEGIEFGTNAS